VLAEPKMLLSVMPPQGSITRGGTQQRDLNPGDGVGDGYVHRDGSRSFCDNE
jgi:hypothetical protein